jgi:hypothetical protein
MKIDPTEKQLQILSNHHVPSRPKSIENNNFAKVLKETVHKTAETQVQRAPITGPVAGPEMMIHYETTSRHWQVTDGLLNAMENYQKLLADPTASLRTIEPIVNKMKELSQSAQPLLEDLPKGHPVKAVAEEALVQMSKEIERFNAGLYIDGD